MRTLLALGFGATFALSHPAHALNILLTNDDGCGAPGIDAMYRALTSAGHQVTLVAPLLDSSGIGAASVVIPGQALAVTQLAAGKYCVGPPTDYRTPDGKTAAIGTPVDAVNVGLDLLLKDNPPDLLVSGSNFGDNVGPLTQMSGTVNAAVRAMHKGIPAIAVSTAIDLELFMQDQQAGYRKTLDALEDTARFATRVIDRATTQAAKARRHCPRPEKASAKVPTDAACALNLLGLPGSHGLNINYPARPAAEVQAVVFAPIGSWSQVNFVAQRGADGEVRMNMVKPAEPSKEQQQTDGYQLYRGNAVISVIDTGLNASGSLQKQVRALLQDLRP
jgi:5'-nucleotidase